MGGWFLLNIRKYICIESMEHLHKSGAYYVKSGSHLLYKSGSHHNICPSRSLVGHSSLAEARIGPT